MIELDVPGGPFAFGEAIGRGLKSQIQAFLKDDLDFLQSRYGYTQDDKIYRYASRYSDYLKMNCPSAFSDLLGLSEGASISQDQASYLQYRREVHRYFFSSQSHDCTLLSKKKDNDSPVLAQTIDLEAFMEKYGVVLRVKGSEKTPAMILYTFCGLLGYAGMNSEGLCIGINMVNSETWVDGVSPYLLVRMMLEEKRVEDCLGLLQKYQNSSSRSFTIMDGHSLCNVELTCYQMSVINSDSLIHTNHYLHESMANEDASNVFARLNSKRRFKCVSNKLIETEQLNNKEIISILSDHSEQSSSICSHAVSNSSKNSTVAAIIMRPNERYMLVSSGPPCENRFKPIKF